jgi:hypothetical protein
MVLRKPPNPKDEVMLKKIGASDVLVNVTANTNGSCLEKAGFDGLIVTLTGYVEGPKYFSMSLAVPRRVWAGQSDAMRSNNGIMLRVIITGLFYDTKCVRRT